MAGDRRCCGRGLIFDAPELNILHKFFPAATKRVPRADLLLCLDLMLELLTTTEMSDADRLTIAGGTPGIALMEAAGAAVADAVGRMLQGRDIVVVAGQGNNGGDGFVAARLLAERGHKVRVTFLGERSRLKDDAAQAAARWKGATDQASFQAITGRDVIVDALFGAGLDRPVEGLPRAVIEAMNQSGAPIIAVDLPSGINGTTGAVMGTAV